MTRRTGTVVAVGLLVALLVAGVLSSWASSSPDGLERVAATHGMDAEARDHEAPFSGYTTDGIGQGRVSTGVAGMIGVAVTFGIAGGLTLLLRRRPADPATETAAEPPLQPARERPE